MMEVYWIRISLLLLFCAILLFPTGYSQDDNLGSGVEQKQTIDEDLIEEQQKKVRLAGSVTGNAWEGRLEVLHKGKWGTVCDDGWNMGITDVVCRWLGYTGALSYFYDAYYGTGRGDIWLDDVVCFGNETSLWKCRHNPPGQTNCRHTEDVGVRCNKQTLAEQKSQRRVRILRNMRIQLRTDSTLQPPSDGFLEVLSKNKWHTICSDGWDQTDSKVVCGMLGFPDALPVTPNLARSLQRRKSMILTGVDCSGKESLFGDCPMDDLINWKDCTSGIAVQIKCRRGDLVLDAQEPMKFMNQRLSTMNDQSPATNVRRNEVLTGVQNDTPVKSRPRPWLRLRAGGNFGEGRVEVKYRGQWGTVCSKGWNKVNANVVCRQLGFGTVKEIVTNAGFGQGVGAIWLHKLNCKGDEADLLDCFHGSWNASSTCKHEHDAGVKCHVPDIGVKDMCRRRHDFHCRHVAIFILDVDMRANASIKPKHIECVVTAAPDAKVEIIGGTRLSPNEGRVMVLLDDTWGTVCSEGWDLINAAVLCRQLGLGHARYALQTSAHYGAPNTDVRITDLQCDGTERMIQECQYREFRSNDTCMRNYRAGVVCTDYLADIVLDLYRLEESVFLQDWPNYLLQCAAEENCLSSVLNNYGSRRLVRFSSAIMNRGTAAFRPFLSRYNWVWHACHVHYHSMEVFTHYDLLNLKGERVAEGHKASFCLEDVYCDSGATPYFSCEGEQGISPNCVDLYENSIDCQWIDITGVKPDSYLLRIDSNPDAKVAESDYSNNEILCQVYYNGFQIVVGGCRYDAPEYLNNLVTAYLHKENILVTDISGLNSGTYRYSTQSSWTV